MTLQLEEGQSISNRFTLLHKLQEAPPYEIWLALDANINERVNLKFLTNHLEQTQYDKLNDAISRTRSLVHPNISRIYDLCDSSEGYQFLVSQYVHDPAAPARSTTSLKLQPGSHKYQLELLAGVLDALEYAHSLNLVHGNLNPSTILIDASGHSYLDEFGLVDLQEHSTYQSPQVRAGLIPARKDDVYSLGALLYQLFTGVMWDGSGDFQTDFPVPKQLQTLVLSMLSEAPYERPGSISEIRSILNDYTNFEDNILDSHSQFVKPSGATAIALPESTAYQPLSSRETRVVPTTVVIPVLFLLLLSAALVFVYLPGNIESVRVDEVVFDQPAPVEAVQRSNVAEISEAPFQQAQLAQFEQQANTLAAQLLRQQLYLEDQGVKLWAPDSLTDVQNQAQQGDTFFRAEKYLEAINSFQTGIEVLEQLSASVESIKADNLQSGQDALNDADSNAAQNAFEIVLAIESTNISAQEGFKRAIKLDEVLILVDAAISLEDSTDLEAALQEFKQASVIDPQWAPAVNGYTRVKQKISKRDFNQAMSHGFTALKREQFDKARHAFNQAQTILPDSTEPADALHQIELAMRLKQIAGHRKKALAFQDSEHWQEAADEYARVLELDPSLLFASEGQSFAEQRAVLAGRLNRYINNPVFLNDSNEYESASQLMTLAGKTTQSGPTLNQQVSKLANLIKLARTPVQVELRSDKLTDVTVYRVGRLGRLDSTQLTLYPGSYRVVGKRRGYRDVQQEFTLVAGQDTPAIFVSCTEKI